MKPLSIALFTTAMLGLPSAPGLAQQGAGDTLARRSSTFLFEHNLLFRLTNERFGGSQDPIVPYAPAPSEPHWYATWEAGLLRRVDSSSAVGFSAFAGADDDASRLGVRARYRRWLSRRTALDVGAGLVLSGGESGFTAQHFPAFSGLVTLSQGNWFGLTVQVEAIRSAHILSHSWVDGREVLETSLYETDWGVYAGARFGGLPGVVMAAAELVVLGIAVGSAY